MRYPLVLLALTLTLTAVLAISPPDRLTWALENALFVAGLAFLWTTRRKLRFSNPAYTLIFVFSVLHQVGAYYTYTLVPYDIWFETLTGRSLDALLGWERNNYDRVVHFAFGLLLAYPMRELFLRVVATRGSTSYVLPVQMVMSLSAVYELVEWSAASVFGDGTGAAYVGAQGDVWDAQKDMALAGAGALACMLFTAALHRLRGRDPQGDRRRRYRRGGLGS